MFRQAQIQGQQHANEVARLKQAMATLLEEAGERTRREVRVFVSVFDIICMFGGEDCLTGWWYMRLYAFF